MLPCIFSLQIFISIICHTTNQKQTLYVRYTTFVYQSILILHSHKLRFKCLLLIIIKSIIPRQKKIKKYKTHKNYKTQEIKNKA